MKSLLNAIIKRLVDEVPQLKYVDVNWQQLDGQQRQPAVKYPFAIVEIDNVKYSSLGLGWQQGVFTLRVSVGDLKLARSSTGAGSRRLDAFHFYDLVETVHQTLHGFRPTPLAGRLSRRYMAKREHSRGLDLFDLEYVVSVKQPPAETDETAVLINPVVKKES